MANFTPEDTFDGVRQIETTDRALGGDMGSPINMSLQSLVNRTHYISSRIAVSPEVEAGSESVAGTQRYATQSEVQTSEDLLPNNRIVSPLRLDQLITRFAAGTIPDASETVTGLAELATLAESQAGTDDDRVLTVAGVKRSIDTFFSLDVALTSGVWDFSLITTGAVDTVAYISTEQKAFYYKFSNLVFAYLPIRITPTSSSNMTTSYDLTIHSATPIIATGNAFGIGKTQDSTGLTTNAPRAVFSVSATTHNSNPALEVSVDNITREGTTTQSNHHWLCYIFLIYTTNA